MTDNDRELPDQDLRDRFAALRRQEEAQAPASMARPATSRQPLRPRFRAALLAAAACLLAIAAAGLWLRTVSHRTLPPSGTPAVSIADWKAPTDFLLNTPGREMLQTVPSIGAFDNSLIAPRPQRGKTQSRNSVMP